MESSTNWDKSIKTCHMFVYPCERKTWWHNMQYNSVLLTSSRALKVKNHGSIPCGRTMANRLYRHVFILHGYINRLFWLKNKLNREAFAVNLEECLIWLSQCFKVKRQRKKWQNVHHQLLIYTVPKNRLKIYIIRPRLERFYSLQCWNGQPLGCLSFFLFHISTSSWYKTA